MAKYKTLVRKLRKAGSYWLTPRPNSFQGRTVVPTVVKLRSVATYFGAG